MKRRGISSWILPEPHGPFSNIEPESCCSICFLQIGREVLDAAARVVRPGVTTDEIDDVVHEATIAAGLLTP